jgi:glyoxalase family protein
MSEENNGVLGATKATNSTFRGHHHITLAVGGAQEDYDFHTKLLGLRSVKKTVIFVGNSEAYHLYYGDEMGHEGQLVTTFPLGPNAPRTEKGSDQVKTLDLSIPVGSMGFWQERLNAHEVATTLGERLGEKRLVFDHPCGIGYALVESEYDSRTGWVTSDISHDVAIKGTYGITVSTRQMGQIDFHMGSVMGFDQTSTEGAVARYETGNGGAGTVIDFELEPERPQGSWGMGVGAVHHTAFWLNGNDDPSQATFKDNSESFGYMDISERKNRNYFQSIYFRNPSGALFEATYSDPQSFLKDEAVDRLGTDLKLPPWLETRRDELIARLEPIVD